MVKILEAIWIVGMIYTSGKFLHFWRDAKESFKEDNPLIVAIAIAIMIVIWPFALGYWSED